MVLLVTQGFLVVLSMLHPLVGLLTVLSASVLAQPSNFPFFSPHTVKTYLSPEVSS